MGAKHYAARDITSDELMQRYMDHVDAMTGEGLHSKSDIAAELAYRDALINELSEKLAKYVALVEGDSSEDFLYEFRDIKSLLLKARGEQ
ncbi:hypothetical protein [Vreelandella glaciei]|uniref:hypothetical protein n=1 Tax=Vreelandella glaciei TaxID=186761 RepID=UPI0030ED321E|tara:strand:+ start:30636 stop:30905 length:270 start_codon:yes stop_codon:yes gene_type:complete